MLRIGFNPFVSNNDQEYNELMYRYGKKITFPEGAIIIHPEKHFIIGLFPNQMSRKIYPFPLKKNKITVNNHRILNFSALLKKSTVLVGFFNGSSINILRLDKLELTVTHVTVHLKSYFLLPLVSPCSVPENFLIIV